MKLAKGFTHHGVQPDLWKDVPLEFKLAATNLATQFYRVTAEHWDVAYQKLQVRVYRDVDTLNPTLYNVVKRNGVMYRQESNGRYSLWPCYPDKDKQPPQAAIRRPPRPTYKPIHKTAEVVEDNFGGNFHSLVVERTEYNEELRRLELRFLKAPHPDLVLAMTDIRKKMTDIEMRIVMQALMDAAA